MQTHTRLHLEGFTEVSWQMTSVIMYALLLKLFVSGWTIKDSTEQSRIKQLSISETKKEFESYVLKALVQKYKCYSLY